MMIRCLLITLSLLVVPVMARAPSSYPNQNIAINALSFADSTIDKHRMTPSDSLEMTSSKFFNETKNLEDDTVKVAQFRDLGEKLAKSEYVVEKGELSRRPNSHALTSTSLSHDVEFQVMKKSLDAAKAKLTIPDGSSVVIIDGKEYYDVIVGNPPPKGVQDPDYSAKVLVDKKTLAVVQILTNDMKNLDDDTAMKVAQFRDLSAKLATSEYVVEKGQLIRRPNSTAITSTSLSRDEEFEVMKKSFEAAKAKLSIPNGSGVIIIDGKQYYEIVIGNAPPAGSLGPDYTAKVMVDKKSRAVVQILAGG